MKLRWGRVNQHLDWVENRISVWDCYSETYFGKKFHDAIAEAAKPLVPYFEILHVGFVKIPCDGNLVFCSCVLDAKWTHVKNLKQAC